MRSDPRRSGPPRELPDFRKAQHQEDASQGGRAARRSRPRTAARRPHDLLEDVDRSVVVADRMVRAAKVPASHVPETPSSRLSAIARACKPDATARSCSPIPRKGRSCSRRPVGAGERPVLRRRFRPQDVESAVELPKRHERQSELEADVDGQLLCPALAGTRAKSIEGIAEERRGLRYLRSAALRLRPGREMSAFSQAWPWNAWWVRPFDPSVGDRDRVPRSRRRSRRGSRAAGPARDCRMQPLASAHGGRCIRHRETGVS